MWLQQKGQGGRQGWAKQGLHWDAWNSDVDLSGPSRPGTGGQPSHYRALVCERVGTAGGGLVFTLRETGTGLGCFPGVPPASPRHPCPLLSGFPALEFAFAGPAAGTPALHTAGIMLSLPNCALFREAPCPHPDLFISF